MIAKEKSGGKKVRTTYETSDRMAGTQLDRLADKSVSSGENASRKRRLLKGPEEFREIREDQRKEDQRKKER